MSPWECPQRKGYIYIYYLSCRSLLLVSHCTWRLTWLDVYYSSRTRPALGSCHPLWSDIQRSTGQVEYACLPRHLWNTTFQNQKFPKFQLESVEEEPLCGTTINLNIILTVNYYLFIFIYSFIDLFSFIHVCKTIVFWALIGIIEKYKQHDRTRKHWNYFVGIKINRYSCY
jgi:hypothetical protein